MADVDHPKTHVEDQDLKEPRKQPESPQHEGIDPLTEGDTMYPKEDTKAEGAKLAKKQATAPRETQSDDAAEATTKDQEERNARANTPSEDQPTDGSDKPSEADTPKDEQASGSDEGLNDPSSTESDAPKRGSSQGSTSSRSRR